LACEPGGCSAPVAGYSACLTSFTSSIRFSLHAYSNTSVICTILSLLNLVKPVQTRRETHT
ncbi:MAG: hypothetical protein E7I14_22005, partial [Escherichia coli]|nr:hypothetical protein [Escherichia coli]